MRACAQALAKRTTHTTPMDERGASRTRYPTLSRRALLATSGRLLGLSALSLAPNIGQSTVDQPLSTMQTRGQARAGWDRPTLTDPVVHMVTDASRTINASGRDLLVIMPDRPYGAPGTGLRIENFRNLQLIGGELNKSLPFRAETASTPGLRFPTMLRGFSGASGGRFRFSLRPSNGSATLVQTALLPHTATATDVHRVLERVAGQGSIHSVTGKARGGPWSITPSLYDHRLGRPVLDVGSLTGNVNTISENPSASELVGIWLHNFTGVAHLEGLWLHGEGLADALVVSTHHSTAVLQLHSCRLESEFYRYHSDHHHADAAQFWCGPAEFRASRCDFITHGQGQGLIYQPRKEKWPGSLQALRSPTISNSLFATYPDEYSQRRPSGIPLFREDGDTPNQRYDPSNWEWHLDDVYAYAPSRDTDPRAAFGRYWYHQGRPAPAGLNQGVLPAEGSFANPLRGQCGLDYAGR